MTTATTIYHVTVVDRFCGVKGYPVEECETTNEQEAKAWMKQWKEEYDADSGYKVKRLKQQLFNLPNHRGETT